jgi:hypothetical protein
MSDSRERPWPSASATATASVVGVDACGVHSVARIVCGDDGKPAAVTFELKLGGKSTATDIGNASKKRGQVFADYQPPLGTNAGDEAKRIKMTH